MIWKARHVAPMGAMSWPLSATAATTPRTIIRVAVGDAGAAPTAGSVARVTVGGATVVGDTLDSEEDVATGCACQGSGVPGLLGMALLAQFARRRRKTLRVPVTQKHDMEGLVRGVDSPTY